MTCKHKCLRIPDAAVSRRVACSLSPPACHRALDAMQHILLTNEGERAAEVSSCQMLLHMHHGPSKLVRMHQAPVAREQKKLASFFQEKTADNAVCFASTRIIKST